MLDRPPSDVDRKRLLRRARNRRYRDRQRQRHRVLTFTSEIDETGIGWMIAHGYLSQREADDPTTLRASIGRAITALIRVSSR